MRRALLAAALWCAVGAGLAASPQPTEAMVVEARALFIRLVERGETPERIAWVLSNYFGQDIDVRDYGTVSTDFRISRRDPKTGELTFWTLVGSIPKN